LDEQGWVNVDELLKQANAYGHSLDQKLLNHVVETNSKKRFAFDDSRQKIRASQGHSVDVELGYQAQMPPEIAKLKYAPERTTRLLMTIVRVNDI